MQLSGLDQNKGSLALRPSLWPQGMALTPGGLTPRLPGQAWGAHSGLSPPGHPHLPVPTPPPFFLGGGRGLVLPDTQEGEGLHGSAPENTQLGILTGWRRAEIDPSGTTPWFQDSGVHGKSAPRLNWGEMLCFPEELSPDLLSPPPSQPPVPLPQ